MLPEPLAGLTSLRAVLKSDGVLRVNYHSQLQRAEYFRAQKLGDLLGLMERSDQNAGLALFRTFMRELKKTAPLKQSIWGADYETDDGKVLANHLLRGDKGTTVPEFLEMIRAAGLEFIRMVNWQSWSLLNLFDKPEEVPDELKALLERSSLEEKLHLYELISPNHRLLDVWCGYPLEQCRHPSVEDWTADYWQSATIHLHPQLLNREIRDKLRGSALTLQGFDFNEFVSLGGGSARFDTMLQASLLPLWESPQPVGALVRRWKELHPVNPVTLTPLHDKEALLMVRRLLIDLVNSGYLMACRPEATTA